MDPLQIFIDYNGVPIEVISYDNGSPKDFVFVGGFSDPVQNHPDIFEGIAAKGYNVHAINMPGHGNSGTISRVNWQILSEILDKCIQDLGLGKITVGGFSMGGGVALKYASETDRKIEYVRVLSPLCYELPHLPSLIMSGVRFFLNFRNNAHDNPTHKPAPFPTRPIYYAQSYGDLLNPPEINVERLRELRVHIIVGKSDEIIDIQRVREVFNGLENVEIVEGEDFGHDIYYVREFVIEEIANSLVK